MSALTIENLSYLAKTSSSDSIELPDFTRLFTGELDNCDRLGLIAKIQSNESNKCCASEKCSIYVGIATCMCLM